MAERRTQEQIKQDSIEQAQQLLAQNGFQVSASQTPIIADVEIELEYMPKLAVGEIGSTYPNSLVLSIFKDSILSDMDIYISTKGFVCLKTQKAGPYLLDQNGNTWGTPSLMPVLNGKFRKVTDYTTEEWYNFTGQIFGNFKP